MSEPDWKQQMEELENEEEQRAEEAREAAFQVVQRTGRVFMRLSNDWWGNEKLGVWCPTWFVDIEQVTDKAVRVKRAVEAPGVIRNFIRDEQRSQKVDRYKSPGLPQGLAMGPPNARSRGAWFPKSAIEMMVTADPPNEFTLFAGGEVTAEGVSPEGAEVVILERCVVSSKWGQYGKYTVELDYELSQELKEKLEWDEYHFGPWYQGDTFLCWTIDDDLPEVAEAISKAGYTVAVLSSLME